MRFIIVRAYTPFMFRTQLMWKETHFPTAPVVSPVIDQPKGAIPMYCKFCGQSITEGSVFCSYCGKKQNDTTPYSSSSDSKNDLFDLESYFSDAVSEKRREDDLAKHFDIQNGVLVKYKNPDPSVTHVVIPDGITEIGNSAFSWNGGHMKSITLPESLQRIGAYAFSDCDHITSLTIPRSVTFIHENAFYSFPGLTDLTLCCNVTKDVTQAFIYIHCENLTRVRIANGVRSIGDRAFLNFRKMTSISIPDSVTDIGSEAFRQCENLTDIALPDGLTSLGEGAFAICRRLQHIYIPRGITRLRKNLFSGCYALSQVDVTPYLTDIEQWAFDSCPALASLYVPRNVRIQPGAFNKTNCTVYGF